MCLNLFILNLDEIGDLLDVYRKYITSLGWKVSIIDSSAGDDGGFKNVVLDVKGDMVYSRFKWEAGKFSIRVEFDAYMGL